MKLHIQRSWWLLGFALAPVLANGPARADVLVNNPAADTSSLQDTQSESTVIAFGSTLVAAFNDSGSFINGTSNHFTGWARSTDDGLTWTDLGKLPDSSLGDAGDPILSRSSSTGTIFLTTLPLNSSNALQLFRSTDNGVTFSRAVNAAPGVGSVDKPWSTVDNFAGSGNGNVYTVVRDFGASQGIKLWKSTDDGLTFGPSGGTLVIAPSGNVEGPNVVVGPDHAVYVGYFNNTGATNSIQIKRSTDTGVTFGAASTITTLNTALGINGDLGLTGVRSGTATPASFRSNAFPQVAVNPVSGNLYAVFNDKPAGSDKADVFITTSTDGGSTWSAALRVNDDATTTDQWSPTLAVTPDGTHLGVFWYDRRGDTADDNLIDYYGQVYSLAGSLTTDGANFRISDVSFPPEFGRDPVVNSVYMGDYDRASADNSTFYVAWGDNRDLSAGHAGNNANVRFDTVDIAAVPEPASLGILTLAGLALLKRRLR